MGNVRDVGAMKAAKMKVSTLSMNCRKRSSNSAT